MKQLAKAVVARNAALPVAQDVDRRKVDELLEVRTVAPTNLAHTVGKVLQRDGAGAVHAEGIDDVLQRRSIAQRVGHGVRTEDEVGVVGVVRCGFQDTAGPIALKEAKLDVVGQQRVQYDKTETNSSVRQIVGAV